MREPSEFYYCLKEQLKKIRIQEENKRELEEIRKIIAAQKAIQEREPRKLPF